MLLKEINCIANHQNSFFVHWTLQACSTLPPHAPSCSNFHSHSSPCVRTKNNTFFFTFSPLSPSSAPSVLRQAANHPFPLCFSTPSQQQTLPPSKPSRKPSVEKDDDESGSTVVDVRVLLVALEKLVFVEFDSPGPLPREPQVSSSLRATAINSTSCGGSSYFGPCPRVPEQVITQRQRRRL